MRHLYLFCLILFYVLHCSVGHSEVSPNQETFSLPTQTSDISSFSLPSAMSSFLSSPSQKVDSPVVEKSSVVRVIAKKINKFFFRNFNKKFRFNKKKSLSLANSSATSLAQFEKDLLPSRRGLAGLEDEEEDDEDEEGLQKTIVLLFMFFGLSLGILVMQALSYVGEVVPYTVIIFILGMIFALCDDRSGKSNLSQDPSKEDLLPLWICHC